jgi:hypothetical protein
MIAPNQPFDQVPFTLGNSITPSNWNSLATNPTPAGGGYYLNSELSTNPFVQASALVFNQSSLTFPYRVYASYIYPQPIACDYALMTFVVENFTYSSSSAPTSQNTYAAVRGLTEVRITGNGVYRVPIVINPLPSSADPISSATNNNRGTNFIIEINSVNANETPQFRITNITIQCIYVDENCTNCKTGDYQQPLLISDNPNSANQFTTEELSLQVSDGYCGNVLQNSNFQILFLSTASPNFAMYFLSDGILNTQRTIIGGFNTVVGAPDDVREEVVFSYDIALVSWITAGGPYVGNSAAAISALKFTSPSISSLGTPFNELNTVYRVRFYLDGYGGVNNGNPLFSTQITIAVKDQFGNLGEIGKIVYTDNVRAGYYEAYYTVGSSISGFGDLWIYSDTLNSSGATDFSYKISELTISKLTTHIFTAIPNFRTSILIPGIPGGSWSPFYETVTVSQRVSRNYSATVPQIISDGVYYYYKFNINKADNLAVDNPCFRILITQDKCFNTLLSPTAYASDLDVALTSEYTFIQDPCNTLRIKASQDSSESKEACAFGFTYPTIDEDATPAITEWYHLTRVYGELRNPQYDGEMVSYQDSRGKKIVVYAESREFLEMVVNLSPKYVHNFLRLACRHDLFSINDSNEANFYFTRSETYSPTWIRTRVVAPAFLEIEVKEQDLRKELCCAGLVVDESDSGQRLPEPEQPYAVYGPDSGGGDESDTIFDLTFDLTFE